MKIEGGRVKILKKCTEFVIRVIKAHHIPALSDDQSLNLCVKSNIKIHSPSFGLKRYLSSGLLRNIVVLEKL